MELAPSFLQAVASLLIVIGLIYLTGWVLRKFSASNGGLSAHLFTKTKTEKQLRLVESLWLDARYRIVLVEHNGQSHKILLGPQQALQLTELPTPSDSSAHVPPSDFLQS